MNRFSIVLCTRNRSHLLGKVIACFDHKVIMPADLDLELVIVDNNSTDATGAVVSDCMTFQRPYSLRYAREEKSGLSHARNRGIETATHDRIGFLDDDIEPDVQFLQAISAAFTARPDIQCFAHRVITRQVNRPEWYCLDGRYRMLNRGIYDLGAPSRLLAGGDPSPIGSGMIFSRSLFAVFGAFNPAFGYDLSSTMMVPGEESEYFFKVREKGIPIFYVHDAVINHYPQEDKYDVNSLCKTYKGIGYWYGSVDARNLRRKNIKTLAGYPRSYYKRFGKAVFNYFRSRLSFNKTAKYYHLFYLYETSGYFAGFRAYRGQKAGRVHRLINEAPGK